MILPLSIIVFVAQALNSYPALPSSDINGPWPTIGLFKITDTSTGACLGVDNSRSIYATDCTEDLAWSVTVEYILKLFYHDGLKNHG